MFDVVLVETIPQCAKSLLGTLVLQPVGHSGLPSVVQAPLCEVSSRPSISTYCAPFRYIKAPAFHPAKSCVRLFAVYG